MLSNQYLLGNDQYPSDLTQAYGMLVSYKVDKTTKSKSPDSVPTQASDDESDTAEVEEDMTFLQHSKNKSNDTKETREQYSPSISNSNFQEAINLYMDASTSPVDGTSLDTTDFSIDFCCTGVGVEAPTLEQNYDHIFTHVAHIDSNWVLLDTQSTVHLFKPSNLLTNIHTVNDGSCLTCYSNGGSQRSDQQGCFSTFGTVWCNPDAIANILSFAIVSDVFPIDYVQNKNTFSSPFPTAPSCLLFVALVQMGRPSPKVFQHMLFHKLIRNTSLTADDAARAECIFGLDIGSLKGKQVRRTPSPVIIPTANSLPPQILERHKQVSVCADVFFVDGVQCNANKFYFK